MYIYFQMCSHVEISLVLEIKTVKVLTYVKSEVVCVHDEELCHEDTWGSESVALCFLNFGTGWTFVTIFIF